MFFSPFQVRQDVVPALAPAVARQALNRFVRRQNF